MCYGVLGIGSCGHYMVLCQIMCFRRVGRCYMRWPTRRVDWRCQPCEIRDQQLTNLQLKYQGRATALVKQCDIEINNLTDERTRLINDVAQLWEQGHLTMSQRTLRDEVVRQAYRQKKKNIEDLRDALFADYEDHFGQESKVIREYWEHEAENLVLSENQINPKYDPTGALKAEAEKKAQQGPIFGPQQTFAFTSPEASFYRPRQQQQPFPHNEEQVLN